jgi:hypothetical protein
MFGGLLVVTLLFSGGKEAGGLVMGLLLGGLLFFAASWLLSKFGYAPKSMTQIRQEAVERNAARAADPARTPRQSRRAAKRGLTANASPSRPKPPPTKRTASGVGRHPQPRKR